MILRLKPSLQWRSSSLTRWSTPSTSCRAWQSAGREAQGPGCPFPCGERGGFCRNLHGDVLGWCGLGSNNTLCLCSLSPQRSSKGFPDIISLFLIIIPWHARHQWVNWLSHNYPVAELGPGCRSPDFWPSSLLIASCGFWDGRCALMEKKWFPITVVHFGTSAEMLWEKRLLSPPGSWSWRCMHWLQGGIWARGDSFPGGIQQWIRKHVLMWAWTMRGHWKAGAVALQVQWFSGYSASVMQHQKQWAGQFTPWLFPKRAN